MYLLVFFFPTFILTSLILNSAPIGKVKLVTFSAQNLSQTFTQILRRQDETINVVFNREIHNIPGKIAGQNK